MLQAIELDVRREYGAHYRVLRASSGREALETLRKVKVHNEPATLLLVDQ